MAWICPSSTSLGRSPVLSSNAATVSSRSSVNLSPTGLHLSDVVESKRLADVKTCTVKSLPVITKVPKDLVTGAAKQPSYVPCGVVVVHCQLLARPCRSAADVAYATLTGIQKVILCSCQAVGLEDVRFPGGALAPLLLIAPMCSAAGAGMGRLAGATIAVLTLTRRAACTPCSTCRRPHPSESWDGHSCTSVLQARDRPPADRAGVRTGALHHSPSTSTGSSTDGNLRSCQSLYRSTRRKVAMTAEITPRIEANTTPLVSC